jgi:hypothetical protein
LIKSPFGQFRSRSALLEPATSKKVGGADTFCPHLPGKMLGVLIERRSQVAVSSSDRESGQVGTKSMHQTKTDKQTTETLNHEC